MGCRPKLPCLTWQQLLLRLDYNSKVLVPAVVSKSMRPSNLLCERAMTPFSLTVIPFLVDGVYIWSHWQCAMPFQRHFRIANLQRLGALSAMVLTSWTHGVSLAYMWEES